MPFVIVWSEPVVVCNILVLGFISFVLFLKITSSCSRPFSSVLVKTLISVMFVLCSHIEPNAVYGFGLFFIWSALEIGLWIRFSNDGVDWFFIFLKLKFINRESISHILIDAGFDESENDYGLGDFALVLYEGKRFGLKRYDVVINEGMWVKPEISVDWNKYCLLVKNRSKKFYWCFVLTCVFSVFNLYLAIFS